MPKERLVALNEACRAVGAAFVLALNLGVTTSLFSDFGPKRLGLGEPLGAARHVISDEDGEPTQMLVGSQRCGWMS